MIDTRPLLNLGPADAPDTGFITEALKFLEGRGKGRMIFLNYDPLLVDAPNEGLKKFVETQAKDVITKNITVNMVTLGITEEFLLKKFNTMGVEKINFINLTFNEKKDFGYGFKFFNLKRLEKVIIPVILFFCCLAAYIKIPTAVA